MFAVSARGRAGPNIGKSRNDPTAVLLPGNAVLLIGGCYAGRYLADTLVLDPGAKSWRPGPKMATPRNDPTAVAMYVVFGGVGV